MDWAVSRDTYYYSHFKVTGVLVGKITIKPA